MFCAFWCNSLHSAFALSHFFPNECFDARWALVVGCVWSCWRIGYCVLPCLISIQLTCSHKLDAQFYLQDLPLVKMICRTTHMLRVGVIKRMTVSSTWKISRVHSALKRCCYYLNRSVSVKYRLTHAIYSRGDSSWQKSCRYIRSSCLHACGWISSVGVAQNHEKTWRQSGYGEREGGGIHGAVSEGERA